MFEQEMDELAMDLWWFMISFSTFFYFFPGGKSHVFKPSAHKHKQGRLLTRDRESRPDVLEAIRDPYIRKSCTDPSARGRKWDQREKPALKKTTPLRLFHWHKDAKTICEYLPLWMLLSSHRPPRISHPSW